MFVVFFIKRYGLNSEEVKAIKLPKIKNLILQNLLTLDEVYFFLKK